MTQQRQRVYSIVGIVLAVLMAVTLILPGLAPATPPITQQTNEQFAEPTLPPPPVNYEGMSFATRYLHPSGLFTFAQPTGFTPTQPSNTPSITGSLVQVNMRNSDTLSVIEAVMEITSEPVETLEALSARLDNAFLQSGWRSYTSWRETARSIDSDNGRVRIDFELTLGQQRYLARHISWLQDGWIYSVRAVAPQNARDYLLFLLENSAPTLERVEVFADTPASWTAFYSPEDGYIVRHPVTWRIVDGDAGAPITFEGNNTIVRMESVEGANVADEASAQAFVQSRRPNAQLLSVSEVDRNGKSGFRVAYSLPSLEGTAQSGVVLLLNGEDRVYVADARINRAGLDFNALPDEGVPGEALDVQIAFDIFTTTDDLNLPVSVAADPF